MVIDIFVLFRKIYGLNLEFHSYLIFRVGLYSGGGFIFGGEFVLVSRGLIFGGLILGGLIFGILRYAEYFAFMKFHKFYLSIVIINIL